MKNLIKTLLLISLFTFIACEDPHKDSTFKINDFLPASAYLDSRSDEFSEWVDILKYADLYNAINQATVVYTVFAPTNDAVREFYEKKDVVNIRELGVDYARQLVKSHLVLDSISREDFIAGGTLAKKTLNDSFLEVSFGDEGGINSVYLNEGVPVREFAISTANGLVYVLGGVMRPFIEGIYTQMKDDGKNSILVEAMELTSWSDTLDIISDIITLPNGSKVESRRYYTVLAVSDEVFKSKGISSVQELISNLGADSDYKNKDNALFRYVAYHILEGNYKVQNLKQFDIDLVESKFRETLSDNNLIKVSKENDDFFLNYDGGNGYKAQFIDEDSDYPIRNGYIHQINDILPICKTLVPTPVYFDVTNNPQVASYIASNGAEGMIYQTPAPSELNVELPINQFSCYSVTTSPAGSLSATQGDGLFRYQTVKNTDYEYSGCLNKDFLIIGLGRLGHVTMKTPPILSGRYKITLRYLYANTMSPYRDQIEGNGGLTTFAITDMSMTTSKLLYSSLGSEAKMGLYDMILFEDVNFSTTGTHSIKIILDDAAASVSKNYRIRIDYILFEPI